MHLDFKKTLMIQKLLRSVISYRLDVKLSKQTSSAADLSFTSYLLYSFWLSSACNMVLIGASYLVELNVTKLK